MEIGNWGSACLGMVCGWLGGMVYQAADHTIRTILVLVGASAVPALLVLWIERPMALPFYLGGVLLGVSIYRIFLQQIRAQFGKP